jgi:hypothetical protein
MSATRPYEGQGHDGNGKAYISGPGCGFGYNAGTLWPSSRFDDKKIADACAFLCNEAYLQGYERARFEIRTALGIKD